jgi:hypothetical protein
LIGHNKRHFVSLPSLMHSLPCAHWLESHPALDLLEQPDVLENAQRAKSPNPKMCCFMGQNPCEFA